MAKKKNFFQKLHELKKNEKKTHQEEVQEIVVDTYKNEGSKRYDYNAIKKVRWFNYLITFGIAGLLIGISFLLGIFALNSIAKTQWVVVAFLAVVILIWFGMGWYKNKTAANYFNDSRRRYHSTLTDEEATIKKIRKMLFLLGTILALSSIIIYFTV